jgi:hypothetical protein
MSQSPDAREKMNRLLTTKGIEAERAILTLANALTREAKIDPSAKDDFIFRICYQLL